jgi:phenylpropionate dioxygenase-like ring-hydroxylating dioxygenase large terminal subunit/multimeric flavodoxin WrbA
MEEERGISVAIVYHSARGHTARMAAAVAAGARSVHQTQVHLISVEEVDEFWPDLESADAIIFGAPTYMGSASAQFKTFMDSCSARIFRTGKWTDKFAAGFTNGSSRSGDKLNTLLQFVIFSAQLGMNWVSLGLPPANDSSEGSEEELNRHSYFVGAAAQSNRDQCAQTVPPRADLLTGEFLGRRVAALAHRVHYPTPIGSDYRALLPVMSDPLVHTIQPEAMTIETKIQPVNFLSSQQDVNNFDALVEDIVATASLPLTQSRTLPRHAYLDESYFEHESRAVLASGWMCVAHVSQLETAGSYRAVDLLGEPLVVVRDQGNQVKVLSRVCPHRGTDILHECFNMPRSGVTKRLTCPYHAWSFSLDGKLNASPEMHKAEGFERADWRLVEVRSEVWEGFIFVNLDGTAPPLTEQYKDFSDVITPWKSADMKVVIELQWECEFNWKVMVENWMESYHHMGIHSDTLQRTMPARTTWTEPEHPAFIRCHLPFKPDMAEQVRAERDGGERLAGFTPISGLTLEQETEWGLFLGFPCFMFLTMRDRVLWYQLEPVSADRCRLKTFTLVSKDNLERPDFSRLVETETKMLSDFHSQDMQVNTAVQRGLGSVNAVRGRLSHLEEPVWLIQRYVAARLQGRYPVKHVAELVHV